MQVLEKTERRTPEYEAEPFFVNRWSPRAMSGEQVTDEELMTLFEAAKWAPSSYNNQSWRFLYAKRESADWDLFFELLTEGNQAWAKNAAVLIVIVSRTTFENGKPSRTHSFDAGAAWENFALQGFLKGLSVHGMEGFDYDAAHERLQVPEDFVVEAMAAVGRPGKKDELPPALREREFPSDRKKLSEIVFEGTFGKS